MPGKWRDGSNRRGTSRIVGITEASRSYIILSRMQTSVFELLTCVVWGCPECYVMLERGTGIKARRGN